MIRKDASTFPTEYSVTPLRDDNNRHTGWLLVVRDTTARKYQENLLRESESRFRNLTESSPDAILVFQDDRLVFCNEAAWKLLGARSSKELLGNSLGDFTPADPEFSDQTLKELCTGDRLPKQHTERYITRLDGTAITAEVGIRETVYFGRPALQVVAHDVSDRKEIEKKLRETTRDLQHERELLTSKNAALREVISQVDNEKKDLRSQLQSNVDRIIHPLLRSLSVHVQPSGQEFLKLLQSHLNDLVSPFVRRLDQAAERLSPRELEVCNLISQGLTSKDIARILGISEHTVLKLRQRVRRKLDLTNEDVNLSTYLSGLRDDH